MDVDGPATARERPLRRRPQRDHHRRTHRRPPHPRCRWRPGRRVRGGCGGVTVLAEGSYASPTGQEIVFVLLGVVTLAAAVLVVTTRRLVHAALWLVVAFGALAGCYLVMSAELVAWVQVLIYVGAVVVLLLFGIMLTRAPIGPSTDLDGANRPAAVVVAVALAGVLVTVIVDGFRTAYVPSARASSGAGSAETIGAALFRDWVLPFEALSVLLLAALIGAIVLSRREIGPAETDARRGGGEGEG
ncbi:MAG: NADH-quinone oxidoreductase subunit J [Streptosporangiales bacterium]|nr:NADH-quinone oxidoreductase subunit J [Streptosporangiales bacterium]